MNGTLILFVSPFISHIIATLRIGQHFVERGFRTIYVGPSVFKAAIKRYGYAYYEIPEDFYANKNRSPAVISDFLNGLKDRYSEFSVILEVGFWGITLFLIGFKIKFLMLQRWACGNRCGFLPPFYLFKRYQPRIFYTYIINNFIWTINNLYYSCFNFKFRKQYKAVIECSGLLPAKKYVSFKNRSSFCIILNIPELILYPVELDFPRQNDLETRFVGPFICLDRKESYFDFNDFNSSKPIVLISFGSLTYWLKDFEMFFQKIIDAFSANSKYELVINAGRLYDEFKGSVDAFDNIHIYRSVP